METMDLRLSECNSDPEYQGLEGLSLLLHHTDTKNRSKKFPLVQDFSWEIFEQENRILIHYTNQKTLEDLMDAALGDIPNGLIVFPGYCGNRNDVRVYATATAHHGFLSGFTRMKSRADRRTSSVGEPVPKKDEKKAKTKKSAREAFLEDYPGTNLWSQVSPKSWQSKNKPDPIPVRVFFNPQTNRDSWGFASTKAVRTPRSRLSLSKNSGMSAIHPDFMAWNEINPKLSVKTKFLASFAGLSYFYIRSDVGTIGVGYRFPTFTELWKKHKLMAEVSPSFRFLHRIQGGVSVAAGQLILHLGLPLNHTYTIARSITYGKETYPVLANFYMPEKVQAMYKVLQQCLTEYDELLELRDLPYRERKEDKKIIRDSAYDLILFNLEHGLPWYMSMADLSSLCGLVGEKEKFLKWTSRWERTLGKISERLGSKMENQIRLEMHSLYMRLAYQYAKGGKPTQENFNRAREFLCKTHLRGVMDCGKLAADFAGICTEAGGVSNDVMDLVMNTIQSGKAIEAKKLANLMILGLFGFDRKTKIPEALPIPGGLNTLNPIDEKDEGEEHEEDFLPSSIGEDADTESNDVE